MRRDTSDPLPQPAYCGRFPTRERMQPTRLRWANRNSLLMGLVLIGVVWFMDGESGLPPPQPRLARGSGEPETWITRFAFSTDGNTVTTLRSDGTVALRSPTEGWSFRPLLGYPGRATALSFAPGGQLLAIGGSRPEIILCDLQSNGAVLPLMMPIPDTIALAFSPDGQTLAATSSQTNQIVLWDVAAKKLRTCLRGHSSPVRSLAFSPAGDSLASGGMKDQTIIVWDLATRDQRLRLSTAAGPVLGLAYSPDGSSIVSAGSLDSSIRIWDSGGGRVIRRLTCPEATWNTMDIALYGQLLATADSDCAVRLWNVETGELLARLDGQTRWIVGVAFSPDGRTLAAIGSDNDVRLWEVNEALASRWANN